MKTLLQNRFAQLGIALLAGGIIGATFYPTKTITEKVKKEYQEKIVKLKEEHRISSKDLREEYRQDLREIRTKTDEIQRNYTATRVENRELRSKMKERTLKIIKPDGTIVEETYKESETEQISKVVTSVKEEFTRKVKSIETRYQKIHQQRIIAIKEKFDKKESEYQKRIAKFESYKKTEINRKNLGLEIGINSDKSYYFHPTYDIFGPVFIGGNIEQSADRSEYKFGIGIGIRF